MSSDVAGEGASARLLLHLDQVLQLHVSIFSCDVEQKLLSDCVGGDSVGAHVFRGAIFGLACCRSGLARLLGLG